jgi:AcrR family transcriptional regulator
MARPVSIRNEQILDAARRCFLEHGYVVSTAAIAKEAGVSEGSIFKRFGTKEKLFQESMGLPRLDVRALTEPLIGEGEIERNLEFLAIELLKFFREMIPRVLMTCSQPGLGPFDRFRNNPQSMPAVLLAGLRDYFAAETRLGRLRDIEPEVAARMLFAAVHNFAFFEYLGIAAREGEDASTFAKSVVDHLWHGLKPGSRELES